MATTSTSALTTPAVSTTGTLQRTVNDKIRALFPQNAAILSLVSTGANEGEMIKRQKNLIGKKKTNTPKFESFTYSPVAITYTVSTGGTTTCTVSDSTGLRPTYTVVNTANQHVARVGSISTNDLTLTAITSSFTTTAGDILLCTAPAYAEHSSEPYVLQKDEDNLYNYVQIVRYPVEISASAKGNPHYGGDFWARIKKHAFLEAKRRIENTLIWSERAASGDTTSDTILNDTFRTTRGLWNWAQESKDFGGSMNAEDFRRELPLAMDESTDYSTPHVMITSNEVRARMQEWAMDKLVVNQESKLEKYGVKADRYTTSGPDIEIIAEDSFNRGSNVNKAIVFNPEDVFYCYLRDRDLDFKNGIQSNSTDGVKDELMGEIGIGVLNGGNGILKVTGIF